MEATIKMQKEGASNLQIFVRAFLNKDTIKHLPADCKKIDGQVLVRFEAIRKCFLTP
jgi:hypothetical protein